MGHIRHLMLPTEFFPERLRWQRNLGHNGLDLGFRKRYIKYLCVGWGVFEVVLFLCRQSRVQLFESAQFVE